MANRVRLPNHNISGHAMVLTFPLRWAIGLYNAYAGLVITIVIWGDVKAEDMFIVEVLKR